MYISGSIYKSKQSETVLNNHVFNVRGQQETNFSLEETLLWIMDWYLKSLNHGFVSYKHAAFYFTRH